MSKTPTESNTQESWLKQQFGKLLPGDNQIRLKKIMQPKISSEGLRERSSSSSDGSPSRKQQIKKKQYLNSK